MPLTVTSIGTVRLDDGVTRAFLNVARTIWRTPFLDLPRPRSATLRATPMLAAAGLDAS
jgi:hypothetical protein